jgi:hypothetical protein
MTKLDETLKIQSFSRVSKVFIEYKDEVDGIAEKFNESKFSYALDAIANMIQLTVYLPSEEQCDIFKRKTERHLKYIESQRHKIYIDDLVSFDVQNRLNKMVNSDEIPPLSDQSPSSTLRCLTVENEFNYISPITDYNSKTLSDDHMNGNHKYEKSIPLVFDENENIESMINDEASEYKRSENLTIDDNTSSSMSTMSFQYTSSSNNQDDLNKKINYNNIRSTTNFKLDQTNYDECDINLVENHFKSSNGKTIKKKPKSNELSGFYSKNKNYNEMETSLDEGIGSSGSLSNNQPKSSPNSLENYKSSPVVNGYQISLNPQTIGLIDDDVGNVNINDEDDDNDNETHLGDVVDRCEGDFADLDNDANKLDDLEDEDEEIDINVEENENEMSMDFRNPYRSQEYNQDDDQEVLIKNSNNSKPKQRVKFSSISKIY